MAKKSQKRSIQNGKDGSGCMWSFISIFDFRHGGINQKLLTEKKRSRRHTIGAGNSRNRFEVLSNLDEDSRGLHEGEASVTAKRGVKELIAEEILGNTQYPKKEVSNPETEVNCTKKKTRKKSHDIINTNELISDENLGHENSCEQNCKKGLEKDVLGEDVMEESNEKLSDFEAKLAEAIKQLFGHESNSEGELMEDRKIHQLRELVEVFRFSSLEEEMLLKLVHNPNSLFMKYLQSFPGPQREEAVGGSKNQSEKNVDHKKHKFFSRKFKFQERNPSKKDPSQIVNSHLFLSEMKRKFKHVMGKDRLEISTDGTNKSSGRNSRKHDWFYWERMARLSHGGKKEDKSGRLKGTEISTVEESESSSTRKRVSNIYIEARKHLSEILQGEDEGIDVFAGQRANTLGKILLLPEYSTSSPLGSPRKNHISNVVENMQCISQGNNPDDEMRVEETICANREGKFFLQEETSVSDIPSHPSASDIIRSEDQSGVVSDLCADNEQSKCSKQDKFGENQSPPYSPMASPSSPHIIRKTSEDLETCIDTPDRPSPISILEPLFSDDDISPRKVSSQLVDLSAKNLEIRFEKQDELGTDRGNGKKGCLEEEDLIFDYVKTVLLATGLNWDELCLKSNFSEQLLDPSLYDQISFFSNGLCRDKRLLFDCINKELMDVCQRYSPCFQHFKHFVGPVRDIEVIVSKVWEGVHWHILPVELPYSLEQIVTKDMKRTGTWMEMNLDGEIVGTEMSEAIFEDLIQDTILSCVDEYPENGIHE